MNKTFTPPPKTADQAAPPPFNPWQPPKAALEDQQAPDRAIPDDENAMTPLRVALFAPAVVIGPIACLFMIGAWGWPFVLVLAAAAVVYWRYRRA